MVAPTKHTNVVVRLLPWQVAVFPPPQHGFTLYDDACVVASLETSTAIIIWHGDIRTYQSIVDRARNSE